MGRTFELLIQQSKIWNMVLETVGRRKLKLTRAHEEVDLDEEQQVFQTPTPAKLQ
jgi:hypothetical protein